MTSDEALMILFASYNYNGNYQELIEAREKLEKDLEVLEIIKKYIEFNDYHYNDKDQNCIDILIPESDENYRVIKEWLNNDSN